MDSDPSSHPPQGQGGNIIIIPNAVTLHLSHAGQLHSARCTACLLQWMATSGNNRAVAETAGGVKSCRLSPGPKRITISRITSPLRYGLAKKPSMPQAKQPDSSLQRKPPAQGEGAQSFRSSVQFRSCDNVLSYRVLARPIGSAFFCVAWTFTMRPVLSTNYTLKFPCCPDRFLLLLLKCS